MRSENHPHDALEIKASRLAMAIGVASSRRPHRRYRQWRICQPPIPRDGLSAAKPRWWQLCAAAGSRWRKLCFATNYRRRSSSPGSVRSRRTALSACVPRAFGNTAGRVHRQPPARNPAKPRCREIQPVDKGVNEAHRVVRTDIVVHCLRQKQQLRAVVTCDIRHAEFYRLRHHAGIRSGRLLTQSA